MDSWQERFGTFLPTEAAAYGWDLAALCGKLTTDFRDQQRPDGWIQHVRRTHQRWTTRHSRSRSRIFPGWLTFSTAIGRSCARTTTRSGKLHRADPAPARPRRADLAPPEQGQAEAG